MLICIDTVKLAEIARNIYGSGHVDEIAGMKIVYQALGFDVHECEGRIQLQSKPTVVASLNERWR